MRYKMDYLPKSFKFMLAILVLSFCQNSYSDIPITTDSRIKTFVYSENEVFKLDFQYGYQSSIEFGLKESFETISVGNSNSWKITPVNRRIFIKPLDGDSKTNMTVITNKNVYHFDMHSHYPGRYLDNNLVYVARFFHPQKNNAMKAPSLSSKYQPKNFGSSSYNKASYTTNPSAMSNNSPVANMDKTNSYNYNYTLTGPQEISPVQIFDDNSKTYFLLNNEKLKPSFYYKSSQGSEMPLRHYKIGKYIVVDKIADGFVMKNGGQQVNIYKESN